MARRRIVFLGFDAGDKHLLHQWAGTGDLPHLARLFEQGIEGGTTGLPGVYVLTKVSA